MAEALFPESFRKNKFKSLLTLILTLSICALVVAAGKGGRVQAAPASTIYFDPATMNVANSQSFSLDAKINPGTNQVTAVEVHVTFDHTKFQLTSLTAASPVWNVLSAAQRDNDNGTASIIVGVPATSPPSPVTTTTTVATFAFQATGTGTGTMDFTDATQAAAISEGGNVITARTGAQVTVGRTYGNADFSDLVAHWLENGTGLAADVNTDNVVNSRDIGIMMSNWE